MKQKKPEPKHYIERMLVKEVILHVRVSRITAEKFKIKCRRADVTPSSRLRKLVEEDSK